MQPHMTQELNSLNYNSRDFWRSSQIRADIALIRLKEERLK